MRSLQQSLAWAVALNLFACAGDKNPATTKLGESATDGPNDSDGVSTTGGGPGGTMTPDGTSTGGGMSASGTTGAPDPTTDGGFIVQQDGGVSGQCDPRVQDCPEGQKCTAISDAPGDPWGVNVCVMISGTAEIGEPCDVEGGKYTGIDPCREGTLCLLTDDEGMGGVCVEFCSVDDECPGTPTANCVVYNDGSLPICLPACDPLIQDCPEGLGCYSSAGDLFVCFKVSAMPGEGMPGQQCQYVNQCQAGTFCAAATAVGGCPDDASGCCTPYCPVSGGDGPCQAELGEECLPFFEEGMAPPAYDDVGVCAIPA